MDRTPARAAHIAKDNTVGYQWEEKLLVLPRFAAALQGDIRVGRWEGLGEWVNTLIEARGGVMGNGI